MQFEFAMEFHDVVGDRFTPEEMPKIVASEHKCPYELVQADAFSSPLHGDETEPMRDIAFGLLQKPLGKIPINLRCRQLQIPNRNFAVV